MQISQLNKLVEILESEVSLLRKLHSSLNGEQSALVNGDVEKIRENVEIQISVLKDISVLEEQRVSELKALGPSSGDKGSLTLGSLIEQVPGDHAHRLQGLRSSLREILQAIGQVNKHNGKLINQSLSYIDRTLKMIAGEDPSSKVYTPEGELKCATGRIAVDREI